VLAIDKGKILNIAQKYILKGQSNKAIKEYEKLVKATPNDIRSHLKLGDLYLKNGENEKAIEEYLKVAELYAEDDLNSRAISIYKKVLSIDPKHIEAMHKIAKLYLKEGLRGDAKNYYQSILKIRPNDQGAMNDLRTIEDYQQPKEVLKKVPSIEPLTPPSPPPSEEKAIEEKNYEEANVSPPPAINTPDLQNETESTSPDKDLEMHYHLGIAYKEMELFDYAISEFELASSNPSIRFDCYIMLGNCFMEKGDYDKSIEYYKMATEAKGLADEKLARLYFNLGLAYEANGMTSEALHTFNLVLNLDPSFSDAQDKIKKLQQKRI
jgi:tetratricopeptide (TPR) repeat protein